MTVRIITRRPHVCETDGHIIALRVVDVGDGCALLPFCELCRLVQLGGGVTLTGPTAHEILQAARRAESMVEAPEESYDQLFSENAD